MKPLKLLILIIHVRSGGHVVECRTVNRGDGGSIPPTAVSKLRQFLFTPHLPVSFGRDTKIRWSLLPVVYARGSKYEIPHRG